MNGNDFEILCESGKVWSFLETDKVKEFGNTTVAVCNNTIERFPKLLSMFAKNYQIAVVSLDDVCDISRNLSFQLGKAGWKVFEMTIAKHLPIQEQMRQIFELPERLRFVIGVGTGRIVELCSLLAEKENLEFGIFLTAPSTDYVLNVQKKPVFVLADKQVLAESPKNLVASGVGILLSESLRQFEKRVEMLFYDVNFAKKGQTENNKLFFDKNHVDNEKLFWRLIEISNDKSSESFVSSGEVFAEVMLRAYKKRTYGEYLFVASYMLSLFYKKFLESPAIDALLPPDHIKTMKLLENECGYDFNSLVKRIDILPVNVYFRIKYIISEYRYDLISELENENFAESQKIWRRQYQDAGFWMKQHFSTRELQSLMSLSGELAGGILGFAKMSGCLENYI